MYTFAYILFVIALILCLTFVYTGPTERYVAGIRSQDAHPNAADGIAQAQGSTGAPRTSSSSVWHDLEDNLTCASRPLTTSNSSAGVHGSTPHVENALNAGNRALTYSEPDRTPIKIQVDYTLMEKNGLFCRSENDKVYDLINTTVPCTFDQILDGSKSSILKYTLMPLAVKMHEDRLNRRHNPSSVKVAEDVNTHRYCKYISIKRTINKESFQSVDFVLFVFAIPTSNPDIDELMHRSYVVTCLRDFYTNRPLMGVVNINPMLIIENVNLIVRKIARDILNVMVFHRESLHGILITLNSDRAYPIGNYIIAGPKTLSMAKEHYNCSYVTTVNLSHTGYSYESYTNLYNVPVYWPSRTGRDDLMQHHLRGSYYTAMTLAVIDDLGFYHVDYSKAENMSWGRNASCDLLFGSYEKYGTTKNPEMFCATKNTIECTSDRLFLGRCSILVNNTVIPYNDKYLALKKASPKDYLYTSPVVDRLTNLPCSSDTMYEEDTDRIPGSKLTDHGRCFTTQDTKKILKNYKVNALCADVLCDYQARTYKVRIKRSLDYVNCTPGEKLSLPKLTSFYKSGTMTCAEFDQVCHMNA